jgi:hypothetical protein
MVAGWFDELKSSGYLNIEVAVATVEWGVQPQPHHFFSDISSGLHFLINTKTYYSTFRFGSSNGR